ncbi:MAG: hypothetical protein AB9866_19045 [Syntrophobacteraceae bacterium]
MTIVDKLVWDYHKAPAKDKAKIAEELAQNHFKIVDMEDRYLLVCTNEVNKETGHNADVSIFKSALEERFKNVK